MFVILLKFADKSKAPQFMEAHMAWVKQGLNDNIFVLTGSIEPAQGGALIAHNITKAALDVRISEDPFVAEGIVTPEIIEITPAMVDTRLSFLKTE